MLIDPTKLTSLKFETKSPLKTWSVQLHTDKDFTTSVVSLNGETLSPVETKIGQVLVLDFDQPESGVATITFT